METKQSLWHQAKTIKDDSCHLLVDPTLFVFGLAVIPTIAPGPALDAWLTGTDRLPVAEVGALDLGENFVGAELRRPDRELVDLGLLVLESDAFPELAPSARLLPDLLEVGDHSEEHGREAQVADALEFRRWDLLRVAVVARGASRLLFLHPAS